MADEPIGNLAARTGFEITKRLQKMNRENGKTILPVTITTKPPIMETG